MNADVISVLTVVALFLLGLVSPGPNFFVVAESTLTGGRFAGFLTGLGAATGDALYATCGLFGVARLVESGGPTLRVIRWVGGLYLLWIGVHMAAQRVVDHELVTYPSRPGSTGRYFVRGLTTDLANPKTIVFFASIFAAAVRPNTSGAVRLAMLCGIVCTSIAWRFFLSVVFSTRTIRSAYQRAQHWVERVFGAILCLFGAHLVTTATW